MNDDNVEWKFVNSWGRWGEMSDDNVECSSVVVHVPKIPDWNKFYQYDETIEDVESAHLVTVHWYENQKVESIILYGEKFVAPLNDKQYFEHAESELKKFGTPHLEWFDDRFIGLCFSNLKELTND